MTRVSQAEFGVHSTWPLPVKAERLSRSCPVTVLVVNPSRSAWLAANDTPSLSATIGPEMLPRPSHDPKLPNGRNAVPVHFESDGLRLVTLTRPPSVLRPKSALCGPRTNSTCCTSSRSMLDELLLSCGTPSM